MPLSIRLNSDDNVDIALADLLPGVESLGVTTTERIARGHKFANRAIAMGENIRRYGQIIGAATAPIEAGAHVHVHNIAMADHAQDHAFASEIRRPPAPTTERCFMGFRRPDGRAGTRNYLGVLTSVNCSGSVAQFIAQEAEKTDWFKALGNVDGIVPIAHASGCGMSGDNEGYETLMRTLRGYAQNPHFGGILLVGLGCEVMQVPDLVGRGRMRGDNNFRHMTIQQTGGTRRTVERGVEALREMAEIANAYKRL